MRKNRKGIIGVDVDLTVVESGQIWFQWLKEKTGQDLDWKKIVESYSFRLPYNISQVFAIPVSLDPFDFWRKSDLYDNAKCFTDAKEVLRKLYEEGYDIVFISYCFDCGTHAVSKAQMLRREFDFLGEKDFHFVQTRSKGVLSNSLDYMVDDRVGFLNQMEINTKCFLMDSFYRQDEVEKRPMMWVDNWYTVYRNITGNYFKRPTEEE